MYLCICFKRLALLRVSVVQPVSRKMPFSRCTLQGLLSHKYWWPMTHSLPRHGRFLYLTETLKFSQYCGLQGHPKWEVNFRDFVNIPIFGQNSFFQIRFFGFQMCLKAHLGQFWKHLKQRSSMKSIFNHKFKRFSPNFAKIPTFSLILIKYGQYALFWLLTWGGPVGHTVDFILEFLLGTKIAHVWEEKELWASIICVIEVSVMGT